MGTRPQGPVVDTRPSRAMRVAQRGPGLCISDGHRESSRLARRQEVPACGGVERPVQGGEPRSDDGEFGGGDLDGETAAALIARLRFASAGISGVDGSCGREIASIFGVPIIRGECACVILCSSGGFPGISPLPDRSHG